MAVVMTYGYVSLNMFYTLLQVSAFDTPPGNDGFREVDLF